MNLPAEVEELIASLKGQIVALQAEVADLRRQLGQDSSNSSKPPSSDGLKKKRRIAGSLRGRSGKASGGQKGHQGGTLRQVADPDHVVGHETSACCHCGSPLEPKSAIGVEERGRSSAGSAARHLHLRRGALPRQRALSGAGAGRLPRQSSDVEIFYRAHP